MSRKLWQEQLRTILTAKTKRIAIIGVGHELRGDDAVGVLIVRQLEKHLEQADNLLLVDAGVAPENVTGQLRRFAPDIVLLIDAVDMQAKAGTVAMVNLDTEIIEVAGSTHTLSLRLFANYVQVELQCAVYLLGIQALSIGLGQTLTSSVQISMQSIVKCFLSHRAT